MDGINVFITLIILLIIAYIGLLKAETLTGVFGGFFLLTLVAYMTIYMFNAE